MQSVKTYAVRPWGCEDVGFRELRSRGFRVLGVWGVWGFGLWSLGPWNYSSNLRVFAVEDDVSEKRWLRSEVR